MHISAYFQVHVVTLVESICASQAAACAREYSPGPRVEEPSLTGLALKEYTAVS